MADVPEHENHSAVPNSFVIRLGSDEAPVFAICQTVLVVDGRGGPFDLAALKFELKAAALPTLPLGGGAGGPPGGGSHGGAFAAQAGKTVNINFNQT